jgi:hypothetical protein
MEAWEEIVPKKNFLNDSYVMIQLSLFKYRQITQLLKQIKVRVSALV